MSKCKSREKYEMESVFESCFLLVRWTPRSLSRFVVRGKKDRFAEKQKENQFHRSSSETPKIEISPRSPSQSFLDHLERRISHFLRLIGVVSRYAMMFFKPFV